MMIKALTSGGHIQAKSPQTEKGQQFLQMPFSYCKDAFHLHPPSRISGCLHMVGTALKSRGLVTTLAKQPCLLFRTLQSILSPAMDFRWIAAFDIPGNMPRVFIRPVFCLSLSYHTSLCHLFLLLYEISLTRIVLLCPFLGLLTVSGLCFVECGFLELLQRASG